MADFLLNLSGGADGLTFPELGLGNPGDPTNLGDTGSGTPTDTSNTPASDGVSSDGSGGDASPVWGFLNNALSTAFIAYQISQGKATPQGPVPGKTATPSTTGTGAGSQVLAMLSRLIPWIVIAGLVALAIYVVLRFAKKA
jgi:hypothetical protein